MIVTLDDDAQMAAAVELLVDIEPRFAVVVERAGLPHLRRMQPGLRGLLRIVTDQVLSLKAAETLWLKIERALDPFEAAAIAGRSEADLRSLGLSGAKARAFVAIAAAVADGDLALDGFESLPDDAAHASLRRIRGIGAWTADIYLLACLGRADTWPAGDLALQLAAKDLLGLPDRPSEREMTALALPWQPWRAVAARLLWSHYRAVKGLAQAGA